MSWIYIRVSVFNGTTFAGNSAKTKVNDAVVFTLNDGTYQFAANLSNTRFRSEPCTMPGCTDQTIVLPSGQSSIAETLISYEYDDLYRLTEANYDNGLYYHYAYDAVGAKHSRAIHRTPKPAGVKDSEGRYRLTETTPSTTTSYTYDIASVAPPSDTQYSKPARVKESERGNRLTGVNGVTYTWDNNGNLLNDGTAAYTYDYNNKLVGLTQGTDVYQYAYNGFAEHSERAARRRGDRIRQIVNGTSTNFILDINTNLTQVLQDGTNTYLYGVNRVSQATTTQTEYFLPDALGSVRNLTDENAAIALTQSYTPFGEVLESSGAGQTDYAFTGEMFDPGTGLVFLRARYYSAGDGRFVSRDQWRANTLNPISLNKWIYAFSNPIIYIDLSGLIPTNAIHVMIQTYYIDKWGLGLVIPEYYVPMGSKQGLKFDNENNRLTGIPKLTPGFVDIVDIDISNNVGYAYEIKNEKLKYLALAEINWYIETYNNLETSDKLVNPNPVSKLTIGTHFEWFNWEVIGTNPYYNGQAIVAKMNLPGVISYKGVNKQDIKFPPIFVWEWDPSTNTVEKIRRNESNGWLTSPQVAFEYCKIALPGIFILTPWPDEIFIPGVLKELLPIFKLAY